MVALLERNTAEFRDQPPELETYAFGGGGDLPPTVHTMPAGEDDFRGFMVEHVAGGIGDRVHIVEVVSRGVGSVAAWQSGVVR